METFIKIFIYYQCSLVPTCTMQYGGSKNMTGKIQIWIKNIDLKNTEMDLLRFYHPNFIHGDNNYWVAIGKLLKFMNTCFLSLMKCTEQCFETVTRLLNSLHLLRLTLLNRYWYLTLRDHITKFSNLNSYANCFKCRHYYNLVFSTLKEPKLSLSLKSREWWKRI